MPYVASLLNTASTIYGNMIDSLYNGSHIKKPDIWRAPCIAAPTYKKSPEYGYLIYSPSPTYERALGRVKDSLPYTDEPLYWRPLTKGIHYIASSLYRLSFIWLIHYIKGPLYRESLNTRGTRAQARIQMVRLTFDPYIGWLAGCLAS